MRAAIIGLGLIGGSISLGLRNSGFVHRIMGVENSLQHVDKALSLGLVDVITDIPNAVSGADLVVLAVPVNTARRLLHVVLANIKRAAVVVDMGSTKNGICTEFSSHAKREQFVASHPIAGTEYSGPAAAQANLFAGKKAIICEPHKSAEWAVERIVTMYNNLGAEVVFYDSAEAHDRHAAYVSHISHISSFMLGLTVLEVERDEKQIVQLAGTGFASTVRLAKSSPDTWTPIFLQNATILSHALETYIGNLQKFKKSLETADGATIRNLISEANKIAKIIK